MPGVLIDLGLHHRSPSYFLKSMLNGLRVMMKPGEVVFEVTEAVEGGYDARALGYGIFTQGEDWDDLKAMARDAVLCHFGEEDAPKVARLHLVRSEVIAV